MKKIFGLKINLNKANGQPTTSLPKKALLKMFKKVPREMTVEVRSVKW